MKNFNPLIIVLSVALTSLQSCGDDDTKVADVLVTSHRQTGVFYKLDKKTGEATEIFTPTYGGGTLNEVRAFVYHPGEKLFYASASTETFAEETQSGRLYSINPKTKVATLINANEDDWYAINNWAVADDDSLIGIGYFREGSVYGYTPGVLKFGTDGKPAANLVGTPQICCGNGMLYAKNTEVMQVGNSWDTGDGEIDISIINSEGIITSTTTITTFTGFPDDLSTTILYLKAMAKDKQDNVYGILMQNDLRKTYLVTVDIEGEEITYLSTLGANNDNQYNSLAIIPGNFAK